MGALLSSSYMFAPRGLAVSPERIVHTSIYNSFHRCLTTHLELVTLWDFGKFLGGSSSLSPFTTDPASAAATGQSLCTCLSHRPIHEDRRCILGSNASPTPVGFCRIYILRWNTETMILSYFIYVQDKMESLPYANRELTIGSVFQQQWKTRVYM